MNHRLIDILRAEAIGEDLQEEDHGIHICAMRSDRTLYEIGFVSASMVYQNPTAAHMVIGQIKFAKNIPIAKK